ncbi:MAG: PIN/TRAM domain-containing protein [Dethiobacteria bacterium]
MIKAIIRIVVAIIGFVAGYELLKAVFPTILEVTGLALQVPLPLGSIFGGVIFGFIFYIITPSLMNSLLRLSSWVDSKLKNVPTQDIILGVFGLLVSLFIGLLLSLLLNRIPLIGVYLSLALNIVLVYLGINFVLNRKEEFSFVTSLVSRQRAAVAGKAKHADKKVLDTSVIIDGRITDICKTGFLEGTLVVPGFVLEELRHIADSPDLLKRNRGRRGLDILNKIQKEMDIPVEIYEGDFEDIPEVDSKLVKLAKVLSGKIITNDFNLNKVCELQGVPVLNINELANAVKPVVLPGEEMVAQIIKDGKEAGQGVAYLDDGTMIVVEGGKRHIGENIEVLVTSVLQTAAGRMIFAKPKYAAERLSGGVK